MQSYERHFYEVIEGICSTRQDIVDMESSTEKKFSRHLIFHLENSVLFLNNIKCGEFVKNICQCLKSFYDTVVRNEYLPWEEMDEDHLRDIIVETSNGMPKYICDLAGVAKNRNFRLYMSRKVAKKIPLLIAEEN